MSLQSNATSHLVKTIAAPQQFGGASTRPKSFRYFLAFFLAGAVVLSQHHWLTAIGVGAFGYYLSRFISEVGNDIPVESLILVIASLQWIVGPYLAYAGLSPLGKYSMSVPESEYMMLATPGVLLFSFGLYAFKLKRRKALLAHFAGITARVVTRDHLIPYYLIAIGFAFSFLQPYFPAALQFPAYILTNIKYIGLIYLIVSPRQKNKLTILLIAFGLTLLSSLRAAMFHDLILWSALIGMYAAYVLNFSMKTKIVLAIGAVFVIFAIQTAKHEFRGLIAETGRPGDLQGFVVSLNQSLSGEDDQSSIENVVVRINQGWIISRIMAVVPAIQPHADGETVITAIKASVLPRLLFPDKPIAGGKENYEQYTGYVLQSNTSMGISLLGEAYINFGVQGAWVFMFIAGLVFSWAIKRFFLLVRSYPTFWLWLPLVFLHFVKAETELLVQLNFLVKSFILVYLFLWVNKRFLRLRV